MLERPCTASVPPPNRVTATHNAGFSGRDGAESPWGWLVGWRGAAEQDHQSWRDSQQISGGASAGRTAGSWGGPSPCFFGRVSARSRFWTERNLDLVQATAAFPLACLCAPYDAEPGGKRVGGWLGRFSRRAEPTGTIDLFDSRSSLRSAIYQAITYPDPPAMDGLTFVSENKVQSGVAVGPSRLGTIWAARHHTFRAVAGLDRAGASSGSIKQLSEPVGTRNARACQARQLLWRQAHGHIGAMPSLA